jgi:Ca2+-transporting ATPase
VTCLVLQIAAVYVPILQTILQTIPMSTVDWAVVLTFSIIPVAVVEAVKLAAVKRIAF